MLFVIQSCSSHPSFSFDPRNLLFLLVNLALSGDEIDFIGRDLGGAVVELVAKVEQSKRRQGDIRRDEGI